MFEKEDCKQYLESQGIVKIDIGLHSLRKGPSTYLTSTLVDGPSPISVCHRAGWTLGFKDAYLKQTIIGDQFVGRCVTGLPLHDKLFGVLPPHFKCNPEAQKCVYKAVSLLYPNLANRAKLRGLLTYCLASVLYHVDTGWCKKELPPSHPLFGSILFTHSGFGDNACDHAPKKNLFNDLVGHLAYRGPISRATDKGTNAVFYNKDAFISPTMVASGVSSTSKLHSKVAEVF